MRIVSVANEAGSAGKTSAVVNLGAIAAEKGLEVLVMDLDAQANATTWLGVTEPEKPSATSFVSKRPSRMPWSQPSWTTSGSSPHRPT